MVRELGAPGAEGVPVDLVGVGDALLVEPGYKFFKVPTVLFYGGSGAPALAERR